MIFMSVEMFLVIYVFLMAIMIGIEIVLLSNTKGVYLKASYKSLKNILKNLKSDCLDEKLPEEVMRFYNEYVQEVPQFKKIFPNEIIWLDAIIFRVDSGNRGALILKEYISNIKYARDVLEQKNPFNKCEKYQQGILIDLSKLETSENKIVIRNIISRTEEEFLRLSGDIKKNAKLNVVSIAIGIIGIAVSILMALVNI